MEPYSILRNMLFILDGIVAVLIIIASQELLSTQFGRAALIFGFTMIAIVTILKIIKKI
jgi:hypothetical protein